MKAVGFYQSLPITDENSLQDVEVEKPQAAGKDLLVKVKAISVNPVDTKQRRGGDPEGNEPKILGWDVAGVVEEVGNEAELFNVGDEVYYAGSVTRPGGNSEFHLVDERIVGKKPEKLDFVEAAALPLTTITAWEALFERMHLSMQADANKGNSILIIGAAGGVGSIATQIAKLSGLETIGTASRKESIDWAKSRGADKTINHYERFMPQLEEPVDYILCCNNTDQHWENMAEAVAPQGHIVTIVETKEKQNLDQLKNKSASFSYEFMFTRSMYGTEDMIEQHRLLNEVSKLVDEGKIHTTLTEHGGAINAENLRNAHEKIESGKMIGKIVLENF
ncbi:zinc-binding alcohol dehydrogenase family protein [Natribacillus halophilus]|uniref:Zinc-type alcohol dehydrogenase-like protein n=1 Tax=Natribacillus halophilus TaxID=549003 RepID=A0A1G8PG02_9BACI|nr:zinc-binding alcohol dehydrogenase family protein [Natribacillus halophilus]SDI90720.1 zinc-binding alcohol dehydrogenase family protein [Natribacillus halophilus]